MNFASFPQLCDEGTLVALRQFAADPRCVSIGECGLDFNRNFSPQDVQLKWFEEQVILWYVCFQFLL